MIQFCSLLVDPKVCVIGGLGTFSLPEKWGDSEYRCSAYPCICNYELAVADPRESLNHLFLYFLMLLFLSEQSRTCQLKNAPVACKERMALYVGVGHKVFFLLLCLGT